MGKIGRNWETYGKNLGNDEKKWEDVDFTWPKKLVYEIAKLTYNECTLGGLLGDVNQLITMN